MRNTRDPCGRAKTSAKSCRINRHGVPLAMHKTSERGTDGLRLRPTYRKLEASPAAGAW